jgi:predicted ABC-type ATPase
MLVENDSVWQQVKDGKINGFSIEGIFNYAPKVSKEQQVMSEIYKILNEVNLGGPGSGRHPEGGASNSTSSGSIGSMSPAEITAKYERDAQSNVDKLLSKSNIDTLKLYSDKDGNFNEQRVAFQKQIVDKEISKGSTNLGTTYFLGGAPATGKSSLEKSGQIKYPDGILRVDPDGIKAALPEYNKMLETKNFKAASKVHEESSKLSKDIIKNAVSKKYDAVVDAVGDGSYQSVVDKVQMQRDAGKNVIAHYVTTDVKTSLDRAKQRAIDSGRYVPPKYIKEMHKEISTIFPKLAKNNIFNELHLYDNNGTSPKLIYSKSNGKETIHDPSSYKKFLDKSKG